MENKSRLNFFFVIIAIILGTTLYKQFDFENYKFEKPAIAILYLIVFVFSIFIIIKDFIKNQKNKIPKI